MSIILDGTSGITTPAETVNGPVTATGLISGATNYTAFKNRIINGNMAIDQRNAGASVTLTGISSQFPVDRFKFTSNTTASVTLQQSSTAPSNYIKSIIATVTTADASPSVGAWCEQNIEGLNVADLGWGTASASTATLSFWVRSSLTGTFGGSFQNSARNRSYPFSYTISSANTWEQKTITVAGDTSGTWLTTNGIGIVVNLSLGLASAYKGTASAWVGADYRSVTGETSVIANNGATFYITGVQLEKGSTATSFDYRPYGTELALCQRYYYRTTPSTNNIFGVTTADSTTTSLVFVPYPVPMRTQPSALEQTGTATDYYTQIAGTNRNCSAVPIHVARCSINYGICGFTVASGYTAGQGGSAFAAGTAAYLGWSAEL